jgi:hypothetical protein
MAKRPALPVELVHLIVRTAALMVPDKQQMKRAECSVLVRVTAAPSHSGSSPISRVWFWTDPLDLAKVAAVQLVTMSRDGGRGIPLRAEGDSWFEWGVFSGGVPLREATDAGPVTGSEEAWRI